MRKLLLKVAWVGSVMLQQKMWLKADAGILMIRQMHLSDFGPISPTINGNAWELAVQFQNLVKALDA